MEEVTRDIEALLFASGRPMSDEALASILLADVKVVRKAAKKLVKEYADRESALTIFEENNSWKMLVRDTHLPVVQRVVADTELSRPTLETLAIIAYNHPNILQSEVIHTRGSSGYEHIKELDAAGFITRTTEGRSFKIKLSEKFFEYFDVEGGGDIREIFKDVTIPEPVIEPEVTEQQTLGDMNVVNIDSAEEENPFMTRELGTKPEMSTEEKAAQDDFFSKLDKKIDDVSNKNDTNDRDKLMERLENSEFDNPTPDSKEDEDDELEDEDSSDDESRTEEIFGKSEETLAQEAEEKKRTSSSALDKPLDVENLDDIDISQDSAKEKNPIEE